MNQSTRDKYYLISLSQLESNNKKIKVKYLIYFNCKILACRDFFMADHLRDRQGRNLQNVGLKGCTSNSITSLWNKKSVTPGKDDHYLHANRNGNVGNMATTAYNKNARESTPRANEQKQSTQQSERVVMSKKQLLQFTKKFAINKIDYQQQIQNLRQDNQDKTKRIQVLSQQIQQLRLQEDYLMKIMQQLRDRHINQMNSLNSKNQNLVKMKQGQIDHLSQQIIKIREWLEQQKIETKRCMQFLKIKDQIIQNLQWEIVKYKSEKVKDITFSKNSQLFNHIIPEVQQQVNNLSLVDKKNAESKQKSKQRQRQQKVRQRSRPRINSSSSKKIILRKDKKQEQTPLKSSNTNINKTDKENLQEQKSDISTTLNTFKRVLNKKQTTCTQQQKQKQILNLTKTINKLQREKQQLQRDKEQIFAKFRSLSIENQCLKKKGSSVAMTINYSADTSHSHIKDAVQNNQKDHLLVTKCVFLQKHIKKLTNQLNRVQSEGFLEYCEEFSEEVQDQNIPIF